MGTFGKLTNGAGTTGSSVDKKAASKFTLSETGTIQSLTARVFLGSGATSANWRGFVYSDTAGSPDALLAVTDSGVLTSSVEAEQTLNFTGGNAIQLTAGDYWIGYHWEDPGSGNFGFSRDSTANLRVEGTETFSDGSANPFGTPTVLTGPLDVYVTYTTATTTSRTQTGISRVTATTLQTQTGAAHIIAAGMATFGKTTDGAGSSASALDKKAVSAATPSSTGTVSSLIARLWLTVAGTSNVRAVIYSDLAGAPDTLLASSDTTVVSNTAEQAITFPFTGGNQIQVTSGTPYWIGVHWESPTGGASLTLSRDSTASSRMESSDTWSDGAASAFGTVSSLAGPIDAYVVYSTSVTTQKTQTGVARIEATASQTQTGVSRVTQTVGQTQDGKGRVTTTVTQATTGVARVTVSTPRTQTGAARITATTTRDQTGVANLSTDVTTTRTQTGVSKVTASSSQNQTGLSRITVSTPHTQTGVARITVSTSQTQTGAGSVAHKVFAEIDGKARITQTATSTTTGIASIATKVYTKESRASLPTDNAHLASAYTDAQRVDADVQNSSYVDLPADDTYAIHQFSQYNANTSDPITLTWIGKTTRPAMAATVYLEIYNVTTSTWVSLDSDSTTGAGTDITLTGSIVSGASDYYDSRNFIYARVYQ